MNIKNNEVMNLQSLHEYTGLSISTLYKKCMKREIPYYKVSKFLMFNLNEINLWLQSNRKPTIAELKSDHIDNSKNVSL